MTDVHRLPETLLSDKSEKLFILLIKFLQMPLQGIAYMLTTFIAMRVTESLPKSKENPVCDFKRAAGTSSSSSLADFSALNTPSPFGSDIFSCSSELSHSCCKL